MWKFKRVQNIHLLRPHTPQKVYTFFILKIIHGNNKKCWTESTCFQTEKSWVQIPARYSGCSSHYNVGSSARLKTSFKLNHVTECKQGTFTFPFFYGIKRCIHWLPPPSKSILYTHLNIENYGWTLRMIKNSSFHCYIPVINRLNNNGKCMTMDKL